MSDDIESVFEDVLDEEALNQAEPEVKDEPKEEPKPSGYMSKDDWIAAGKNPDEWVSEDVFKERTLRIKNESRLRRELAAEREDFDNRLKNLNLLTQAQLARQREELLSRRDDAIDVADKQAVKQLDKEIAEIDKQTQLTSEAKPVEKPPEVVEWEEENPWINDIDDPRTAIAQKAFADARNSGKTMAYALRAADKAVAGIKSEDKTPSEIRKKPPVPMVDAPNAAQGSKDSATLSWSQLKHEEVSIYEEFFKKSGMSQKDYLKTVADQRKGA